MFEKEAEKYASDLELIYKKGVLDGYNKCKEEFNQNGLALQSDMDKTIEQNIALKKELNKANEWHYPSKGEYPKCDEKTQLMFYVNCYYKLGDETVTIKRIVLGYYKKAFLRDDEKVFVEKSRGYEDEHLPQAVIAWKEIILPGQI